MGHAPYPFNIAIRLRAGSNLPLREERLVDRLPGGEGIATLRS